jgi:DNA adenine methylase
MTTIQQLLKPDNVSSVPKRSPFRYPGGKTWLVPAVRAWLCSLPFRPERFYEPFAGGGIISLTVAFENLADHVQMVELDSQVAAVWRTVLHPLDAEWLADRILSFVVTPDTVKQVLETAPQSVREQGFQTIVKNRTYHGGILANGSAPIRRGENGRGIGSRWYARTLADRIRAIAAVRDRISFSEQDGMTLLSEHLGESTSAWFIDPPYSASVKRAGARLYTHHKLDHPFLFYLAANIAGDLLLTYDSADEIRELASCHGLDTELVAMTNRNNAMMTELLIGKDLTWARRLPI